MTARPIRYQRQVSDRKGKIFYTSITSLSHISKGRRIVIEVSNTCEELARPELKHLFDRFYRVDQSHSEAASGSGIGLSVAKATAEALGGKIHAELSGNVICFQITL